MTRIFLFASMTLGLAALALGWTMAGYWPEGLGLLALLPLGLFLVRRKFRPTLALLLSITVLAAALGLWVGVSLSLALTAVVCLLAAWDLDGFSRRLVSAAAEDNPERIERHHLMLVNLVLLLGVSINLVSQSIHRVLGFEWAFLLAILTFYGIGALVNGMRRVEE
jgi:hypothetical protein